MFVSDQNKIQNDYQLQENRKANQIQIQLNNLKEQINRYHQKYEIQNKRINFLKKQSKQLRQRQSNMKVSSSEIRTQNQTLKLKNKQIKSKLHDIKQLFNANIGDNIKQQILKSIQMQPSLFSNKKIVSVQIKNQNILQNTQEVDLTNTGVKDQDVQSLKYFPKIKTLLLGDNQISYQVIADIFENCRNLRKLFLHNTLIQDKGFQKIGLLRQLRCLDVRSNYLTDISLSKISVCNKIVQLSISNNLITDNALKYLRDLPQLNYLDMTSNKIGETEIFGVNVRHLLNLPLTHLYLSHNKIESQFMEGLINMNSLKVLDLRFNRVETKSKTGLRERKPQSLQLFI